LFNLRFDENLGTLTNEVYFESILALITFDSITWDVSVEELSATKKAQCIYKDYSSYSVLEVKNS